MTETIDILKLGQNGQITVPVEFRKDHALGKGSKLTTVTLGNALVLVPQDEILESICDRMIAAMKKTGLSVQDMKDGLAEDRAKIVRERYGHLLEADEAVHPAENLPR